MAHLTTILLFIGAVFLAVGVNTTNLGWCTRVGAVILAVGFGIALLG